MSNHSAIGVIIVTNSLEVGGLERDIKTIVSNLSERIQPEIWGIAGSEEDAEGLCKYVLFKRRFKFDPFLVVKMRKLLKEHPAQILHIYHFAFGIHVLIANLMLSQEHRKKMLFLFGSARKDSRLICWYLRLVGKCADLILANSPSVKQGLVSQGICSDLIEILPAGHDPAKFRRHASKAEIRRRIGLPIERTLLVTTGRMIPTKRHCDLLDAMALIAPDSDADLVILGDGELADQLHRQVMELGLDQRVLFVGFKENLTDYLLACDLFVFPSESEGLPNSLIEASLVGLPIVACRVPGVVDVIVDQENGLLVEQRNPDAFAAAIMRMLSEPDLAESLSIAAVQMASQRYSLKQMISQLEQIYERVLGLPRLSLSAAQGAKTL